MTKIKRKTLIVEAVSSVLLSGVIIFFSYTVSGPQKDLLKLLLLLSELLSIIVGLILFISAYKEWTEEIFCTVNEKFPKMDRIGKVGIAFMVLGATAFIVSILAMI